MVKIINGIFIYLIMILLGMEDEINKSIVEEIAEN